MVPHDDTVARAARRIRVLSVLAWPASVEERFMERWRAGDPELPAPPKVEAPPDDLALAQVVRTADMGDPLQAFVARTAESYRQALAMLQSCGTQRFVFHGTALYGNPHTPAVQGGPTVLEEAEHLLATVDALDLPPPPKTLTSEEARVRFQRQVDRHFTDPLPVELDPGLVSLAAAGSLRIRLRGDIHFAATQIEQLLQHEALVHSATKRNGQAQPLKTLGLSSPRTTAVQEGLATVAELITDTLDLNRLRRIALRVRLVAQALDGADFIEVFEALLDANQPEREAFRSAMRIFRGGDVHGGVAFTKDVVYLRGLRQVHSFLLASLRAHRADLPEVLFCGRLTCGDAVILAPYVADGTLKPPGVLPPWVAQTDRLAAYLAWAAFGQGIAPAQLSDFQD